MIERKRPGPTFPRPAARRPRVPRRVPVSGRGAAALALALALAPAAAGPARAQTGTPTVAVEEARMSPIVEQLELVGSVTSLRVARVSTAVAGLVEEIRVDNGNRVAGGDVLVKLDSVLERIGLERASAATREAREELSDAKRRLKVAERLGRRDTIPENQIDDRRAEVRIDAAALARLEAEEKAQAERLRRHTISAPFAGVVARKMTEVGEWVTPGTPVVELVSTEELRIDVPVPQQYYPRIDENTQVSVRLDARPGTALDAHIGTLVPVSDPSARTFTMRVVMDEPDVSIIPGMSAQVVMRLGTGERDVVVSRDALIRHPDGRVTVWTVERASESLKVAEKRVETGLAFDGRVQIRQGIEAGERVVVRGNEALREGQTVRLAGDG